MPYPQWALSFNAASLVEILPFTALGYFSSLKKLIGEAQKQGNRVPTDDLKSGCLLGEPCGLSDSIYLAWTACHRKRNLFDL